MSLLIGNPRNVRYPADAQDPIEAINIRMKPLNTRQNHLIDVIGEKAKCRKFQTEKKSVLLVSPQNRTFGLNNKQLNKNALSRKI